MIHAVSRWLFGVLTGRNDPPSGRNEATVAIWLGVTLQQLQLDPRGSDTAQPNYSGGAAHTALPARRQCVELRASRRQGHPAGLLDGAAPMAHHTSTAGQPLAVLEPGGGASRWCRHGHDQLRRLRSGNVRGPSRPCVRAALTGISLCSVHVLVTKY
jgi:hypothetical protein